MLLATMVQMFSHCLWVFVRVVAKGWPAMVSLSVGSTTLFWGSEAPSSATLARKTSSSATSVSWGVTPSSRPSLRAQWSHPPPLSRPAPNVLPDCSLATSTTAESVLVSTMSSDVFHLMLPSRLPARLSPMRLVTYQLQVWRGPRAPGWRWMLARFLRSPVHSPIRICGTSRWSMASAIRTHNYRTLHGWDSVDRVILGGLPGATDGHRGRFSGDNHHQN